MAFTLLDISLIIGTLLTLYSSFVYFLVLFSNAVKVRRIPSLPEKLPNVSIIVPAYNEGKNIAKTLEALLKLDYPKKLLEIIAVNDGSQDNTFKIMKKFQKFGVRCVTKPNGGKASALNAGLKVANGEIIVCADADSYPEPDVLKKTLGYFKNQKVAAVTTSLKVTKPKSMMQKLQFIEYILNIIYRKSFALLNSIFVVPGPFGLYRRSTLEKIGGFEEGNQTEDMEIALRMQKFGYKIENSVFAYTYTHSPQTLRKLFRQRVRWYRGFLINSKRYRELYFNSKYGELGFFTLPINLIFVCFSFLFVFALSYSIVNDIVHFGLVYSKAGFITPIFEFGNPLWYSTIFHVLWLTATITLVSLLYLGLKLGKEKFKWRMLPQLLIGIFIYTYFITITWAVAFYRELRGVELKWER